MAVTMEKSRPLMIREAAILIFVFIVSWYICTRFYLLYLHPLSQFRGPRSAAISGKWLLAQSKTGHAEQILEALHEKYNTKALRIGPNQLHISEPSCYKIIYNQTAPYPKHKEFYGAFGTPHTVFVEDDVTLHKERRRLLNPYFSPAGLSKIDTMMQEKATTVFKKIDRLGPQTAINLSNAFRCVTVDIISQYASGSSMELVDKSNDEFYGGFLLAFDAVAHSIWDLAYQPTFRKVSMAIPKSIAARLVPELKSVFGLAEEAERSLKRYRAGGSHQAYPLIFDGLENVRDDQIAAEAVDVLAAGSDTTAFSLSVGTWHILKNSSIKAKLVAELRNAIPLQTALPGFQSLGKIPYLVACVKESIRVAHAVPGILPRVVPIPDGKFKALVVDGMVVPPGTVVGVSAYTMHNDTALWGADARQFNPDRWLGDDAKSLDQWMVSFSKGSRSCLGQNLANFEATLLLGMLFRLYEITLSDRSASADGLDYFTSALPEPGLRVHMDKLKD